MNAEGGCPDDGPGFSLIYTGMSSETAQAICERGEAAQEPLFMHVH